MELSAAALALAKYLADAVKARDERQSADVLREHIKLIERATGPVLDENKQLQRRIHELEDALRILQIELRAKSKGKEEEDDNAFRVLSLIYDEDGQATDQMIMKQLSIGRPELEMHISDLYGKGFISFPGERLDDPPGYRIIAEGTRYVLKRRRSA